MNVGKSLSIAMAMDGVSNIDMADVIKCSRQYIGQMKNTKIWSGSAIVKFADHFDMKASEFIKLGES